MYNRSSVQVRYDPSTMTSVQLFTVYESKHITTLYQIKPISLAQINHSKEDEEILHRYYSKSQSLLSQLRKMIEEREAAVDALDLPPELLATGFDNASKLLVAPRLSEEEMDLNDHIQLPKDKKLQKEKIFDKHYSLYSEIRDSLYKRKGSLKRLN